jgi:hypothetical protein
MSPKISVLIRKNSDEVIREIRITNQGTDEMILPLFPAYLYYCELLWQHVQPVFVKLQLSMSIGIEYNNKKCGG